MDIEGQVYGLTANLALDISMFNLARNATKEEATAIMKQEREKFANGGVNDAVISSVFDQYERILPLLKDAIERERL